MEEPPGPVILLRPDGVSTTIPVKTWPVVYEATRNPGAYTLTTASGRLCYFAVQPDPREADLTSCGWPTGRI